MYQHALGRAPDPAGLQNHVSNLITGGKSAAEVVVHFFESDEFKNKNLSDKAFLERAYSAVFDRGMDTVGQGTWQGVLKDGCSRGYVLAGMFESQEFKALCRRYGIQGGSYQPTQWRDQNQQVTAFVTRLYGICLGRTPDLKGMEDWTRSLVTRERGGAQVAYGFFCAPEFRDKNLPPREYLEALYEAMLDRPSDPMGMENWLAHIQNGMSYDTVVLGFSQSLEFKSVCERYKIQVNQ